MLREKGQGKRAGNGWEDVEGTGAAVVGLAGITIEAVTAGTAAEAVAGATSKAVVGTAVKAGVATAAIALPRGSPRGRTSCRPRQRRQRQGHKLTGHRRRWWQRWRRQYFLDCTSASRAAADHVSHTRVDRLRRGWYPLGGVARHPEAQGSLDPLARRNTDGHIPTHCSSGIGYKGQFHATVVGCLLHGGVSAGTGNSRSRRGGGVRRKPSPPAPNCSNTTTRVLFSAEACRQALCLQCPAAVARLSNRLHPDCWQAAAAAVAAVAAVVAVVAVGTAADVVAAPVGTAADAAAVAAVAAGTAPAAAAAAAAAAAVHLCCRSSCSASVCLVHLSRHVEHPRRPEPHRQQRGRVPSRSSAPAPSTSPSPGTR